MIGSSIEVIMLRSQEVDMCIVCYEQKVCFQLSCCHHPLCDDCLEHINTQTCVYCRQTNTTDYNYVEDEDEQTDTISLDTNSLYYCATNRFFRQVIRGAYTDTDSQMY
jgi:hypothetical protein